MKTKYIWLLAGIISFTACSSDDDAALSVQPLPELTRGSANFSTYVSLGNSLTAGYSDGALFKIAQENSMPRILASQFALTGGGEFTQPLTNDNVGGLLAGGSPLPGFGPRLVFDGAGPVPITNLNPGATITTDIVLNNPTGPFNNMGVPGAKSYHLLAPNYGDLSGLFASPPTANPYFVRMASSSSTSVLADAMAQAPTFFSLWIGNNDVLGYAVSGGDGTNPITDQATFDFAYNTLISTLTTGGTKGVVANIPNVASTPHFTTVPYNPLSPLDPNFGPQIPTLNMVFGALNPIFSAVDPDRVIIFSETEASAVVIKDESLADISGIITQQLNNSPTFPAFLAQFGLPPSAAPTVAAYLGNAYGQSRQATPEDLFVLPSSKVIGTINTSSVAALMQQGFSQALAAQFSVEGVTLPLEDKWVLIPSEQAEISAATASFNATIQAAANNADLAFVDANNILNQLAQSGLQSGDYILTSDLVTGGAFSLDGVHLTSRGYAAMANEFLKSIDAKYNSNFEASGHLVDIANFNTNYSAGLQ
ncbi:MAG: G-D-S-L family lipolytic protein [Bizionia paragorgiae]|uniref:G-D-S-L family lipolytic protein n=1 Tax=Bizionia paragorgiae TaxID=283786 RepID=UPI003C58D951